MGRINSEKRDAYLNKTNVRILQSIFYLLQWNFTHSVINVKHIKGEYNTAFSIVVSYSLMDDYVILRSIRI